MKNLTIQDLEKLCRVAFDAGERDRSRGRKPNNFVGVTVTGFACELMEQAYNLGYFGGLN